MLLIDKYAYFNRLRHVHPVEKVVLTLSLLLFSLAVRDVLTSLITFIVMSAFILFGAKIPFSYYVKLLILPSLFLLTSVFPILFTITSSKTLFPNVLWYWNLGNWQVFISKDSLTNTISLMMVVLSSISSLYFLTLTTPLSDLMNVLRKLKLPIMIIEIIELTYRFIFIFIETALEIYQSQASRLGYCSLRRGIHSLGNLISTLFLGAFQRSKQLMMAMNARGYQESFHFVEESYRYSVINWIIIFGILVSQLVIYFAWRLG